MESSSGADAIALPDVKVDEKDEKHDERVPSVQNDSSPARPDAKPASPTPPTAPTSSLSPPMSPTTTTHNPRQTRVENYYASRPKFDRLGNPIPQRSGAMASVYGGQSVKLPGDLGARDPRRPKSPAPARLPGDLGPNDPRRPRSTNASPAPTHQRHASDPMEDAHGVRLEEDPPEPGEESGEEGDADNDTDIDESRRGRGRKRPEPGITTAGKATNLREESIDSEAGFKPDPTKGESKISFSGDTRIKPTTLAARRRVHPSTAFDVAISGTSTPVGSDDESHLELRAAQMLSLNMSAIHSTPSAHRVIRQIIRGDYAQLQLEAEQGRKRQRMYLVATDLSSESEYALEWTIGTVLRDGDTLLAVYAVDEEEGTGNEGGVEIGQGATSVMDTAAMLQAMPANNAVPPSPGPSPLARASNLATGETRSHSRSVHGSADLERRRALEDITKRCVHLLRKTRLQVRVVVEVFHCKSPRHMITEVIDFLSPTLVIIGSRGRSAVKGVLLGSFSNYLVTKSSVPVMVARKKLRKHSKTARNPDGTPIPYSGSGRTGRFSNMIEAPKTKGLRVGGWDKVGID